MRHMPAPLHTSSPAHSRSGSAPLAMSAQRPVPPQREQVPLQSDSQHTPSVQKPDMQVEERLQPPPLAMTGSHSSVALEQKVPLAQLAAVHAPSQIVPSQVPVGQSRAAGGSQMPELLHAPPGKKRPALQRSVPHALPVGMGDQAVVLTAVLQLWQALVGFAVPEATQVPAMRHVSGSMTFMQLAKPSSQMSVVQLELSSQGEPVPRQEPVALQRSVAVQYAPSLQEVPEGERGYEHTPAVQVSVVHWSSSSQTLHIMPPMLHAEAPRPLRHAAPSQQPGQQTLL